MLCEGTINWGRWRSFFEIGMVNVGNGGWMDIAKTHTGTIQARSSRLRRTKDWTGYRIHRCTYLIHWGLAVALC